MAGHRAEGPGDARRILDPLARGRCPWLTLVIGRSMEPTLRDGQLVPTRRLRWTDAVLRGDLVLVEWGDPGHRIVKRVIGLPNEHIAIIDGHVVIDGRPLDEPYAQPSIFNGQFCVPGGAYLLLGDKRDASTDSRTWEIPYVPRHQITGRLRSGVRGTNASALPRRLGAGMGGARGW